MADHPKREPAYWGEPEQDTYGATSIDEAMEDVLGECDPANLPEEVELVGMAPRDATKDIAHLRPVERCLEILDDEYGEAGEYTKPTDAMLAIERVLVEVLKIEYHVRACEEVCRKTIVVADWLRDHPEVAEDLREDAKEVQGG
jgi:hypothetical protein